MWLRKDDCFEFAEGSRGNCEVVRVRSLTDGRLLEGEGALADVVLKDGGYRVVNLSATMANIQGVLEEGTVNSALTALEIIQHNLTTD